MFFRRCCYCAPLRHGCIAIGLLFIFFYTAESLIHNDTCLFARCVSNSWQLYVMAIIIIIGIVSSLMLVYGAYKEKRALTLVWIIAFLFILCTYILMAIVDIFTNRPNTWILVIEVVQIAVVCYSLMIVHSYYNELSVSDTEPL